MYLFKLPVTLWCMEKFYISQLRCKKKKSKNICYQLALYLPISFLYKMTGKVQRNLKLQDIQNFVILIIFIPSQSLI